MAPGPLSGGQGRDVLVDEVRRALESEGDGTTVVVGASGGPDSAALLSLVAAARPDLRVLAVHVRHGLRDDREDVAAVTAQALAVAAELRIVPVEVRPAGEGVEAAARRARHRALQAAAGEVGAGAVLLAHTADDQAETVLLRASRGAGARGLSGMRERRPTDGGVPLVRPLLRVRRSDVHAVAAASGLPVATDPSNVDPDLARSHLRAEVLPRLGRHAGDPVGALARAADLLRDDADHLDDLARDVVRSSAVPFAGTWSVPDTALEGAPAITRRIVRLLARSCGVALDAAGVEEVLALAPGRLRDRDGLVVSRGGGWTCLAPTDLGTSDVTIDLVHEAPRPEGVLPGGRASRMALALPRGLEGVGVRARRPGDRLATAVGTRTVKDVLVDAGVPRLLRDRLPLLVQGDRVLWVPGVEADAEVAAAGRRRPDRHAVLSAPSPAGPGRRPRG